MAAPELCCAPRLGEEAPRPFEAFLDPHQRRIRNQRTVQTLEAIGIAVPALDAPLLRRYFERYRSAGLLPSNAPQRDADAAETTSAADFERLLRQRTGVRVLRVVAAQPFRFASVNGILNFVAGERAADTEFVAAVVEQHRRALAVACRVAPAPTLWRVGFVLALRQFLVTRLPMYALIHRFRPQLFLPKVARSAMRLYETTQAWLPATH